MDDRASYERLRSLDRPLGPAARSLALGHHLVRLEGLDRALAEQLDERWGGFVERAAAGAAPRLTLRAYDAGGDRWLGPAEPGEHYRLEARSAASRRFVASYHFALAPDPGPDGWRIGVTEQDDEPRPRILDNAVRYLAARLALEDGGFALHAAGVLRDGQAYLLAGPSRSGKTTATRFAQPARSLGDDFALVFRAGAGWHAPALPFDNSERVPADAVRGVFPVAGIWRLEQAAATRSETLPAGRAAATLLGCAAFPWALPESADRLLEHAHRFVAEARFRVLHFSPTAEIWTHLA